MHLILENVRAFAGRHEIPITPLTILTGENSSGKTTFLAMLAALCDREGYPIQPGFNDPPYDLGSFDTIATYKGGRFGRADEFVLGYSETGETGDKQVEARYEKELGQVALRKVSIKTPAVRMTLRVERVDDADTLLSYELEHEEVSTSSTVRIPDFISKRSGIGLGGKVLSSLMAQDLINDDEGSGVRETKMQQGILTALLSIVPMDSTSLAPIRTKPRRTYDRIEEAFQPTGAHIPSRLAKFFQDESRIEEREKIKDAIKQFGRASGLFQDFRIKRLGKKATDPFQIIVKGSGRSANLIDVGYGISQALPVIAQSVLASKEKILLIQQPEVHLHPRAQAELGSFFSALVAEKGTNAIVETHSDYIVDRVRQEVAKGNIDSEVVSILFFDKDGVETNVYPIRIDQNGNVRNPPSSYREFFMIEELSLLNRSE